MCPTLVSLAFSLPFSALSLTALFCSLSAHFQPLLPALTLLIFMSISPLTLFSHRFHLSYCLFFLDISLCIPVSLLMSL